MQERFDDIMAQIREQFTVSFEPLEIDSTRLEVLSIDNMPQHLDKLIATHSIKNPLHDLPLWAKIWPGSLVLGRLLRKYDPSEKTLLELGAGQGTVGLIASFYGFSKIIVSDVNEMALLFAKANILHNHKENQIDVTRIDLKTTSETAANLPTFDIIAASELLYLQDLHRPLLTFLLRHLSPEGTALFCVAHNRAQPSFAKRAAKHFTCREGHIGITTSNAETGKERSLFTVYELKKKTA